MKEEWQIKKIVNDSEIKRKKKIPYIMDFFLFVELSKVDGSPEENLHLNLYKEENKKKERK